MKTALNMTDEEFGKALERLAADLGVGQQQKTFRERIQREIESAKGDVCEAAFKVCMFLEQAGFSLYGNGWIDDDQELIDRL
jgi:ABC-type hemin transport system substrate-binding protein